MRIASTIRDSIVDGPGLRLTIFTQGCPHACLGCHNPETHDPEGGKEVSVEALIVLLDQNKLTEGLTLSGGDPFLQAEDCAKLAKAARERGLSVWTYTGYRYEQLLAAKRADWKALLFETDVLVDGPYVQAQREYGLGFRGSRNQRLIDVPSSRIAGHVVLWENGSDALAHFLVPES